MERLSDPTRLHAEHTMQDMRISTVNDNSKRGPWPRDARMAKRVSRPLWILLALAFAAAEAAHYRQHIIRGPLQSASRPGAHNCTQKYYQQKKDHFSYRPGATTYPQQYLTYDEYWRGPGGPVFFYGAIRGVFNACDMIARCPASVDGNTCQPLLWQHGPLIVVLPL